MPDEDIDPYQLDWIDFVSSNVDAFAYVGSTSTLYLNFHGDRVYAYDGVPPAVARSLAVIARERGSAGSFYHSAIKNRYPYRRMS